MVAGNKKINFHETESAAFTITDRVQEVVINNGTVITIDSLSCLHDYQANK